MAALVGHKFHSRSEYLQARRLDAGLEYARWVPPNAALFTVLLKECVQHGDLFAVTQVVEVPPSPS